MTKYKNEDKYKKAIKEYINSTGISTSYLAKKYNVNVTCLRTYFKRNGIKIKSNPQFEKPDKRYIKGMDLYLKKNAHL